MCRSQYGSGDPFVGVIHKTKIGILEAMTNTVGPNHEILFVAQQSPEGGFVAQASGASILTEAATLEALKDAVREAVSCHFDEASLPKVIRLRFEREEILTP